MPDSLSKWRFNRREVAGALGDLGVFFPIAMGLVLMNGLEAGSIFVSAGLFYILAGAYFGVVVPVQPMKLIGAYAIATGASGLQISAAAGWMGAILLLLAVSNGAELIGKLIPKPAIRGVQLAGGLLLMGKGVSLMIGTSELQQLKGAAEPYLAVSFAGPIPIGMILGVVAVVMTLLLLKSRVLPAGIAVILLAAVVGLVLGNTVNFDDITPGLHLPTPLPLGLPSASDLMVALAALALPQLPMTLGNAVYAEADLTREYFGDRARRVTPRALSASMGLANVVVALLGGMPLCHGAGGVAAHYRFGARTAGANMIVGALFLITGLVLGKGTLALITLIPFSVLGALLVFAGAELCLTVLDVRKRQEMFVVISVVGVALAANMAAGFGVGVVLAHALKWDKLRV
jgi:SulP family sulfate permease